MEEQFYSNSSLQTDLRQYSALLWRWAWLIILSALLAGVAAYVTSQLQDPVYKATTTLLINEATGGSTSEYAALLTSERLARTYSEMLTTRPVLEEVVQRLSLEDMDTLGAIDVQLVRDTQLINLSVEDTDPERAAWIANTIVTVFTEQNQALQASRFAESKDSLNEQLTRMNGQVHSTAAEIEALGSEPGDETVRARLETELAQYRRTYAELLQSYEQVRVTEAQATSNVVSVEPAIPPEYPVRPRVLMNTALAAVVGMMLAVGFIFLIEALDDTIKNPEDINRHLGLPVLGTILRHEAGNGTLIAAGSPRSPTTEAFRSLRTNIQYASVDYPLRSILITSPTASEGKSTIAANLGIVLAQGGKNIVLVDGDMRRPMMHKLLKLSNSVGLSSTFMLISPFKKSAEYPDNVIQSTATKGLSAITAGKPPPNPSELLASEKMYSLLDQLKEEAEVVIIDSPPVMAVTDATVLAPRVDGVLLVIQPGNTKLETARRAVEQLNRVGANLIGVVLNNVDPKSGRYGYYYRYDEQYYYLEDGKSPSARRQTAPDNGRKRRKLVLWGGLAALLLLIGGWYTLMITSGLPVWLGGNSTLIPSPTLALAVAVPIMVLPLVDEIQVTPTPTIPVQVNTPTPVAIAEDDATPIPSATLTLTPLPPTSGPDMGTPFGTDNIYALHLVTAGQSLTTVADIYGTTVDMLRAVNVFDAERYLWPGDILVVPVGQTDTASAIPFTYHFTDAKTGINELAGQYKVTVDDLRYYNSLGPWDWIPVGRWLIIPVANQ